MTALTAAINDRTGGRNRKTDKGNKQNSATNRAERGEHKSRITIREAWSAVIVSQSLNRFELDKRRDKTLSDGYTSTSSGAQAGGWRDNVEKA
ncbi:hypothetical protein J6590_005222 [Homalodisca vitripennis]|nr:hypothetical protein J6590_005222 [Homalodisca vitripennis]